MAGERGVAGRATRGVLGELDERLAALEGQLRAYDELVAERDRLLRARATLTGERPPAKARVSQDEVAAYLAEHPGSRAKQIADALDVQLAAISSHLYRGKGRRFESRDDGWHVKEPAR